MKLISLTFFILLLSIAQLLAQNQRIQSSASIRRPVFSGGGVSRMGTAITLGQSFAGNKKVGCRIVQFGAQTGVEADTLVFDANCNIVGYWNNGIYIGIRKNNDISDNGQKIIVFPNPTNGLFSLKSFIYNENYLIQIYSNTGELILSEKWNTSSSIDLNIVQQTSSFYFVRIIDKQSKLIYQTKLVKI